MRIGLWLRLFQHHFLAYSDASAAHGEQPAGGLRAVVRGWHQFGAAPFAEKAGHSILDSVTDKVARLQGTLDPSDRVRLGEYLDDIREIERRIQKAEEQSASQVDLPEAPVGIPEAFEDHIKLMFDLQVLAYRAEITRISTMMYARDTSGATYPASGVRDGFHGASHHSNVRANMDRFALINKYHVQMLAYFLEKLHATPDGDGICWIIRWSSTAAA